MIVNWRAASGSDVTSIVSMAEKHFQTEIDTIFTPDPVAYSRNITFAIVNQFYSPKTELVSVAEDENNNLIAYTWARTGERAPWSDDEMVFIKMAHLSLSLSTRDRVKLITDMLRIWENFARFAGVPIICSTTMRKNQTGYLKIHSNNGYDVRGSYAYKHITLEKQLASK